MVFLLRSFVLSAQVNPDAMKTSHALSVSSFGGWRVRLGGGEGGVFVVCAEPAPRTLRTHRRRAVA
jgi:hypothetical protein